MARKDHKHLRLSRSIDRTTIERSNQVIRQLAEAGIKVSGYSLGRKLGRNIPSRETPRQGPLGSAAQHPLDTPSPTDLQTGLNRL